VALTLDLAIQILKQASYDVDGIRPFNVAFPNHKDAPPASFEFYTVSSIAENIL